MADFDDIRPFNDGEVEAVIDRLLSDPELLGTIAALRLGFLNRYLPPVARTIIRIALKREFGDVTDVRGFQDRVESYMARMVADTTASFDVTGLDQLPAEDTYLYLSNHRDITLDPAFTNYSLYHNGRDTVRIAIGDNLVERPYVSDLMRINKSFIVKRSATAPRQLLAALRTLSRYIYLSLNQDGQSIWLAQREGRAKDGKDRTEPSIVKMLSMSMNKKGGQSLADHIAALNIVPVALSYELDPCDGLKAAELYETELHGQYNKAEDEDVNSIAAGISGDKGAVHVSYGSPLRGDFQSPEDVAAEVDRQILCNYRLHPSNYIAYQISTGTLPDVVLPGEVSRFDLDRHGDKIRQFEARMNAIPEPHRPYFLRIYANPVISKMGYLAK